MSEQSQHWYFEPPTDWTVARLADIAVIRFSNVDKKTVPGEVPVRLCNYMDVYANEYVTSRLSFMEASASSAEISRFTVDRGDVIATKDSETPDDIGVPAVVVEDIPNLVCGYHLAHIKPNHNKVDSVFLGKQIANDRIAQFFGRIANGSTRYGLGSSGFENLAIWLPPLPQQRKIARILTTVDNLIERTEALIEKYKSIKQGMTHDLFTRGVNSNGQLRPPYENAPHLYKQSPLGWIPKEWEAVTLRTVYAEPSRNGLYKQAEFYGSGYPMIHMPQMFRSMIVDVGDAALVRVDESEQRRFGLQSGDLLFARRSLTLEGAGQCSLVPLLDEPATFESSIIRVRLHQALVIPDLINQYLNTEKGYRQRLPFIRQVAVSGVSADDVAAFPIPYPKCLKEQSMIMERITTLDSQMKQETAYLCKLRHHKSGLMQDLLTGKVRVNVDEAEEVTADV